MKIVIDIPEDVVVNDSYANYFECLSGKLYETLHNGTPLPKGHGRLVDISEYEGNYTNVEVRYDDGDHVHSIFTNVIPTVIEADKAESEYNV